MKKTVSPRQRHCEGEKVSTVGEVTHVSVWTAGMTVQDDALEGGKSADWDAFREFFFLRDIKSVICLFIFKVMCRQCMRSRR